MKCLWEQLQQLELKDGKNMFIINKSPKLLLVLLFAHQAVLQILITQVHFHVYCTYSTGTPTWSICGLAVSAIIDCQLPPGKLSFSLFKTTLSKNTNPSVFAQLPTWWISTLFPLLLLIQSTQVERPKMDPTRKSLRDPGKERWYPGSPVGKESEGLGWERIVTEHVGNGRYGNLKF